MRSLHRHNGLCVRPRAPVAYDRPLHRDWLWWATASLGVAAALRLLLSPVRHYTTFAAQMRDPRWVTVVFVTFYAHGVVLSVVGAVVAAAGTRFVSAILLG